jgi:hypothetical protein
MNSDEIIIIGHQGWADFFTQNAIYNHYINIANTNATAVTILVIDEQRKLMVSKIFENRKNVKVLVPNFIDSQNSLFNKQISKETCVICHTNLGGLICPREPNHSCKYINYDFFPNCELIKLNAFKNYTNWESCMQKKKYSFAHAMYEFEDLDPEIRINNFKINRDVVLEENQFSQLTNEEYFLVHDDPDRNLCVPQDKFKNQLAQVNLNLRSPIMIDMIKTIENSKEIHLIDSSYSVLIYLLSFSNQKIAAIPKYLYTLNRMERDIGIYTKPSAHNWFLIN